ncbi:MAG: NADH-quinone oxidoreductase subunit [Actinomycetota bacterium]|nr:NADH-quinone oxidoreductase subunit [Actinomycetota bacterium]
MPPVNRVLPARSVATLADHIAAGGGAGLAGARAVDPEVVIAELEASGLRGRGGAGFPTGQKWRTVREHGADRAATTVVVNGAEGEPGTYKDRTILLRNPYAVIEGALVAAHVVGANRVVFAVKATSAAVVDRLRAAIAESVAGDWCNGVELEVFEGPDEYLYGEETALLEALNGRPPFPRVAPPYRRGVDAVVESEADATSGSGLPAHVEMAAGDTGAPPALVDNVETLANVGAIVARGAAWFREVGTSDSPGTVVCTITGASIAAGVGEVAMGTTLRDAIMSVSGDMKRGRTIKAVLPGVSSALLSGDALDTPLTYEAMNAAGSGLGSAGFMVLADDDDLVAAIAGVSRFLAVESCGQCTPCKQDGLAIAERLARVARSEAESDDLEEIRSLVTTVADEARCSLASQHQVVVASLLEHFGDDVAVHSTGRAPGADPRLVAELIDLTTVDERHRDKQPDWTYDDVDSGQAPADRLVDHRTKI